MSLTKTDQTDANRNTLDAITGQPVSLAKSAPRRRVLHWLNWQNLWPLVAYLFFTIVLTWPLVLNFSDGIIHFISSDHYQNLWDIWWFRTALFEHHHNPYYTDVLFYPYRFDQNPLELFFHTLQPGLMLFLAPLSYLLGTVGSYNLLVLFGFAFSGWAMYLLARYYTQNVVAAFIAGLLFDFCAYHLNILSVGQTNLMLTGVIPLYVLFLHLSIAPLRQGSSAARPWLYPALASLTLIVASYIDWYYPMYMLMYSGGLLVIVLVTRRQLWRFNLIKATAIFVSWLIVVSPILFLTLHSTIDADIKYKTPFDFEVIHSAALLAFFEPFKDIRIEPGAWQQPFWGYTALVLAAIGFWFCRKRDGWWLWWLGLILVFGLLSLGPYLRLNPTDDADRAVNSGLPLPYLWLQNIPPVSFSRSPSRFVVMVEMALALLGAYGVSGILDMAKRVGHKLSRVKSGVWTGGVGLLIIVIFCIEMQTLPWPVEKMTQPQIFQQIATEPGNFAIMELPITDHGVQDSRRMYYQTIHHRPIAGGYIARKLTDYYRGDASPFDDYFDRFAYQQKPNPIVADYNQNQPALRLLNLYSFRYVTIYKDDYWDDTTGGSFYTGLNSQELAVWQQNYDYIKAMLGPNSQVYQDDNISVFRVPQAPATTQPVVYSLANWYNPEKLPDSTTYQWAKSDPTIMGLSQVSQKVELKITAWTLQPGQEFDVQLNGQKVGQLTLDGKPTPYVVNFTLPQGEYTIVLHNSKPAISPQSLDPKAQDNRELSLASSHIEIVPTK